MNITKYVEMYSEDLRLKNYAENTILNYCSQVKCFLEYFNNIATKPSEISEQKIKQWLLLANSINGRKHRISAVKLFYKFTGKQPLKFKNIEYPRSDKKLPIVLSQAEVQKMFDVCENLKHKVILALLYSCGLRVSELLNLKWENIDRSRMIINILKGKGNKDRQVMLAASLVPLLEKYYHEYQTKIFILSGQNCDQYTATSVGAVIKQLGKKAGINKRVWTHQMRHNSFTHLVEAGCDINVVQKLAGHSNVKTTMCYVQISNNIISKINSPLNAIRI
jgi:site-specific recombinase XerD